MKRVLLQTLKVIVSLGLLIFLFIRISPSRFIPHLRTMDPFHLAVALIAFFSSSFLGSIQWHMLLKADGIVLPFAKTFRLYFVGLFFNNFMLGNVGGDAVKIYDVTRVGNDPYQVFAVTLLDRVIGITGLCILALIASLILLAGGGVENLKFYIIIFIGCVAPGFALVLNKRLSGGVRNLFGMIGIWKLGERFDTIFGHLGGFRKLRVLLMKLTFLALSVQFLRVAVHIIVGRALGIELTPEILLYFYVFIPLLGLVVALPISVGGLGIREWIAVLLFAQIGFMDERTVLMELLTWAVMVLVSLTGWVFFLQRHLRRG
ncbi:MAG: flippase-like domain-containing protein [Candidatus Krumholzibacteria bacterium]|nr:flippase-like domain-containing protein [Candidatus Krumholzibacteria bacterium]